NLEQGRRRLHRAQFSKNCRTTDSENNIEKMKNKSDVIPPLLSKSRIRDILHDRLPMCYDSEISRVDTLADTRPKPKSRFRKIQVISSDTDSENEENRSTYSIGLIPRKRSRSHEKFVENNPKKQLIENMELMQSEDNIELNLLTPNRRRPSCATMSQQLTSSIKENTKELRGEKVSNEIESIDDSDAQIAHRDTFETAYFATISRARGLMRPAPGERPRTDTNHTCNTQNIKLPALKLPEFGGEYERWIQFNDTFHAIIHNNDTLTTTQKFYYLRSCLSGEAARALDTLEASDANYGVAWDILRARFENKSIIVHNHLRALFELPQISKDSYVSLRALYDGMSQHLRALESLGQPVRSWDSIIIFLLASKLDSASRSEWEKATVRHNELPKLDDFKTFLNQRCQILERLSKDNKQLDKGTVAKGIKDKAKGSLAHLASNAIKCAFCKGSHSIYACKDVLGLSVDKRLAQVKKLNLCTNCLRNNHFNKDCQAGGCKTCGGRHNTLLHFGATKTKQEANVQSSGNVNNNSDNDKMGGSQETAVTTHAVHADQNTYVLLATAKVIIYDGNGGSHVCRALLDSGSQSNFMTKQLAQTLKLPLTSIRLPIRGVNQSVTSISHRTTASVGSMYNNYRAKLSYLVVGNITQELPNRRYNIAALNIPEGLALADPQFNCPEKVDLLLGANMFWELLCVGQIRLGREKPVLQKTKLGWIVSGPIAPTYKKAESWCHLNAVHELRDNLERFWEIEECAPASQLTTEESECESLFTETTKRDENGRFTVHLPFRANTDKLGESLNIAMKRFYALERRLAKNPVLKEHYTNFMKEYQDLGHMTEIIRDKDDHGSACYIPHHSVLKDSSTTTRVRVVFDASAKTSSNVALNDVLRVGPVIQDDLLAILLRFRIH
ncbi:PREDICTED: uncharacterized protein LOC105570983, partial [Vollenhovia emeryi]|uniref:uncharacterized protein LOC105570983 n=1 Tax=Vollenhovia emeryi TaxID=411798 RepID=UPI0005F51EC0